MKADHDHEHDQPLEVHVHGQVKVRPDVTSAAVEAALGPLFAYTRHHFKPQGTKSLYTQEPGIEFVRPENLLTVCWTVAADEDFRQTLDEWVMGLNEIAHEGAALEVSVYDLAWEEDEERGEQEDDQRHGQFMGNNADEDPQQEQTRDDFFVLFVGPTPAAIMKAQRDLLVRDVTMLMERHFERDEMGPVIEAIDGMWGVRFDAMLNSLKLSKPSQSTIATTPTQHLSMHAASGRGKSAPRRSH